MSKKIIAEKTIIFQGSIGANSNLACKKFYPTYEAIAVQSFADVFSKVENGEADYGMIPLENSYAGRVSEIHNLLQDSKVSIVAEHFFTIEHQLAVVKGATIADLKEVISHPQALMQCAQSLRKLNPNLQLKEFSNTAEAAKYVASQGNKSQAVLCSTAAAEINNLTILQKNMQDSGQDNVTIFVVITRDSINLVTDVNPEKARTLTALLFTVRNMQGALYKALGGFATNNVNMIKLESYIPSGASAQANFLIIIEGHPSQKNVALALEELGFFSKNVKLLGTYYADPLRG